MENENQKLSPKEQILLLYSVLGEIGQTFKDEDIEHCLIGGIAVFSYVPKRLSKDIDFLINKDHVNKALGILGKLYPKTPFGNFTNRYDEGIWHIDIITNDNHKVRIDFIIPDNDIETKCLQKNKSIKDKSGKHFNIADPQTLIELKQIAGRDRDLIDIESLKQYLSNQKALRNQNLE